MQPYEIVREALREAPGDVERLLAWIINSAPPVQRQTLHSRIVSAITAGRLTGEFDSKVQPPRLFSAHAADETWNDLKRVLEAESCDSDEARLFFEPDGLQFAPQAYPPRWAPAIWNAPLSPAEVREQLQMGERDIRELSTIARKLIEAEKPVQGIGSGGELVRHLAKEPLRIGVLPYADGLPLATLLYAVSDQVGGMVFGPSSFYRPNASSLTSIAVEDGVFNIGYATAQQVAALKRKNFAVAEHRVWQEGFTRSLLLRVGQLDSKIPQFQQLSFVGQFGPDDTRNIDPARSDPIFASQNRTRLQFIESLQISETIDPIVNWEIPLVLSFASGLSAMPAGIDGLVLTVSTDVHLWAASFGLNLGARPGATRDSSAVQPTIRHAAWDPTHQSEASEVDRDAQLCWFIPDIGSETASIRDKLHDMVSRLVGQPIRQATNDFEDREDASVSELRNNLSPIAQSLIAPLLTALPNYSGPMLAAPPEAWMTKILGPSHYIEYRPRWFDRIINDVASGAADRPLIDHLRKVA